jgi:hypothetical protein
MNKELGFSEDGKINFSEEDDMSSISEATKKILSWLRVIAHQIFLFVICAFALFYSNTSSIPLRFFIKKKQRRRTGLNASSTPNKSLDSSDSSKAFPYSYVLIAIKKLRSVCPPTHHLKHLIQRLLPHESGLLLVRI